MKKIHSRDSGRESEASILGNDREREFPLTPESTPVQLPMGLKGFLILYKSIPVQLLIGLKGFLILHIKIYSCTTTHWFEGHRRPDKLLKHVELSLNAISRQLLSDNDHHFNGWHQFKTSNP